VARDVGGVSHYAADLTENCAIYLYLRPPEGVTLSTFRKDV